MGAIRVLEIKVARELWIPDVQQREGQKCFSETTLAFANGDSNKKVQKALAKQLCMFIKLFFVLFFSVLCTTPKEIVSKVSCSTYGPIIR